MRRVILVAALMIGSLTACGDSPGRIEKRQLAEPNPTSYVFPMPLRDLRAGLLTKLDDFDYMRTFHDSFSGSGYSFAEETRDNALFSRQMFEDPRNANDIFLHSFGAPINSPTPVYFSRGEPLKYFADFQLHFEAVDDRNTKVSVITYSPRVANGTECCSPHGLVAIFQEVEPTSIEEYRLLQLLGRVAGTDNMPPIRLPIEKN